MVQPFAPLPKPCRSNPALLALTASLASLALYIATLAPGLLWGGGDFATFQTYAYLGRVEGDVGVFWHGLWVYLAHPFTWLPVRDPAWRANLAAAVFAAAAVGFVFLSARRITRSNAASLLAAGALALSHTFWTYAVTPKVYSLNTLFLALCIYLLLRWRDDGHTGWLCLSAFLYGLSFLNHLVMATVAAGYLAFVVVTLWPRRRTAAAGQALLLAALSFGLGLAPYLYVLAGAGSAGATGGWALGFLTSLPYVLSHPAALGEALGWGLVLGAYQFPLAALAGLYGLRGLWRRDRAVAAAILLSLLGTLAFLLAAADPAVGGVYVWNLHYYLQAYVFFALALAAGLAPLWAICGARGAWRRAAILAATLAVPVVVYAVAPVAARGFLHNVPDFRPLPGRDNLTYVLSPWKHRETGARQLGEAILEALPPDSVLFADYSIWSVVHYLQVVEGARPDVANVNLTGAGQQVALIREYRSRPHLFLADTYRYYDLAGIREHFEIVPAGPIFRLEPREGG